MNSIRMYYEKMIKITIKEIFTISINWTKKISQFYVDYRDKIEDVSYRKLLTTMIEQEGQHTEYYEESLEKLDLNRDFSVEVDEDIEFDDIFEEISDVNEMTKIDFLKKAVHYKNISIKTSNFLRELSNTDRGKQVFKELSDEESRHMFIFKDHLELEELF